MKAANKLFVLFAAAAACRAPRPTTEVSAAVVAKDQGILARLLASGRSPEEGIPRPIVWAARTGNALGTGFRSSSPRIGASQELTAPLPESRTAK